MQEILAALEQEQRSLLEEIREQKTNSIKAKKKYNELLETAVTSSMNMFAAGNMKRVEIMAKTNLFIFLHDGKACHTHI